MPLDRKSTISGALIAYLAVTAIQTIHLSIQHPKNFDTSVALNYATAALMIFSACMILKERRAGFISALICMLVVVTWNLIVVIEHPVLITSVEFWTNIAIYITATLLAASYALKATGPNQPLQRNASTGSVSNLKSPARRG